VAKVEAPPSPSTPVEKIMFNASESIVFWLIEGIRRALVFAERVAVSSIVAPPDAGVVWLIGYASPFDNPEPNTACAFPLPVPTVYTISI